jgi:hypothetical protein
MGAAGTNELFRGLLSTTWVMEAPMRPNARQFAFAHRSPTLRSTPRSRIGMPGVRSDLRNCLVKLLVHPNEMLIPRTKVAKLGKLC